jgi:carbohydrate-binding DOMON domain-containing protein
MERINEFLNFPVVPQFSFETSDNHINTNKTNVKTSKPTDEKTNVKTNNEKQTSSKKPNSPQHQTHQQEQQTEQSVMNFVLIGLFVLLVGVLAALFMKQ